MNCVYAVLYKGYGEVDIVYKKAAKAESVCERMNNEHWEMMNTPVEYRRKNYDAYVVITIPVDSGEPI